MTRPSSRPGVTACRIAPRNTTVKTSAAPATASRPSVSHRPGATANPAKAAPHTATAHTVARPWRTVRPTGPENATLTRPPRPIAAVNRPSVAGLPPNRSALIAGNSATGRPKTVALRSARNAPASTWLRRMRPAQQPDGERRHQLGHADRTDSQRRPGQVVNLQDDGEPGERAAHRRQQLPGPQPPERPGLAQRRDVGQQPASFWHN